MKSVAIEGKVITDYPIKEFIKKNGESGKVKSLILMDSTGSIRLTFWNEETQKIKEIKQGDFIFLCEGKR